MGCNLMLLVQYHSVTVSVALSLLGCSCREGLRVATSVSVSPEAGPVRLDALLELVNVPKGLVPSFTRRRHDAVGIHPTVEVITSEVELK
ncbi:hypothetical protein GE09DRAFT_172718 [Coniochaeta sp. 2T2.1]|nr:hypothetical protein GE09DRAFT_172718 [Coniochaeta sp. 2T2.1]